MKWLKNYWGLIFVVFLFSCNAEKLNTADNLVFNIMNQNTKERVADTVMRNKSIDTAIFAGGCFWCMEGQFEMLEGVNSVESGYIGGNVPHPSYELVCSGATHHAEAIRIVFDSNVISYNQLLAAFFMAHDPTLLNRQGNDIGTQYRSAIFPINNDQKKMATDFLAEIKERNVFANPVVTSIEFGHEFYKAESYHDDYFQNNPDKPYCQMVVKPKVEHFKKYFADKLKKNSGK
ncbi:MAG TPA: peptide-methionine (S)-S-oxide reductase MsrA [Edaphocola sp.]|nr:peptide-methionine (S)-S-oxide reductase MsrA [Edaphocola sp.]